MRAGITEGEEPALAAAKVRASVEEFLSDGEERRFVEPRLLHLLGLEEGAPRGKEELFGAWRLFFERMAEQGPVALPAAGEVRLRHRVGVAELRAQVRQVTADQVADRLALGVVGLAGPGRRRLARC